MSDDLELDSDHDCEKDFGLPVPAEAHWEGYTTEEEEEYFEFTESEDTGELDKNAFDYLMESQFKPNPKAKRTQIKSKQREKQRLKKKQMDFQQAAKGCKPLTIGFLNGQLNSTSLQTNISTSKLVNYEPEEQKRHELHKAIKGLEKHLVSKKSVGCLLGQNLTRYRAVLAFLKL